MLKFSVALIIALFLYENATAQSWSNRVSTDEFTDETIRVASVQYLAGQHRFSLFVNCRDGENSTLNVGLSGTYINPTGGTWSSSRRRNVYSIPLRFDSSDPTHEGFVEQGEVLFLLGPEALFVKNLADSSRLRINFPQYGGVVMLDFSLVGARSALVEVVKGCSIPILEAKTALLRRANRELSDARETLSRESFETMLQRRVANELVDADGKPYGTLADMIADDTWSFRNQ